MMLFKLSVRNLKKSMKDYMIYFATLILGVAVFYVFNALEKQTVMLKVSSSTADIVKLMNESMAAVSVFVAFVLGFLIVYASNFLMKRRKREFGIYMTLGMSKRNISMILLFETFIIGAISLVAGLILGVFASQGMSIVVANMIEADMTEFKFIVSQAAITKTILYFLVMYLVVLLMDALVVGKTKLINLMNAGRKSEKNVAKNPIVCMIVFIIAVVILGSAYYSVTAGKDNITDTSRFLMQIVKGIISTFMIFWSLSGMLTFISKKSRRFYFKGLNCFTVKELGSRINTTVFSGTIICLMLFMVICIFSSAMSVRKAMNDNLKEMVNMDVNLYMDGDSKYSIEDVFKETNVDMSIFKDQVSFQSYEGGISVYDMAKDYIDSLNLRESLVQYYKDMKEEFIKVGDYNRIAQEYGIEQYSLKDNEYIVVADYESMVEIRNEGLKKAPVIKLGNREYKPKYKECKDGFILMAENHVNFGIILVPDSADLSKLKVEASYFAANYNAENEAEADKIEKYITSDDFAEQICPSDKKWPEIDGVTKTLIYEGSIGLAAMMVFIGVYIGFIFMVSGAAILALKELSEATDNREKYIVLRKIGVDEKEISKSLFAQCAMFFGLPLIVAVIHSIFGIQVCVYMLETMGTTGVTYSIIITAVMIAVIYGVYFLITYYCSKKIIK